MFKQITAEAKEKGADLVAYRNMTSWVVVDVRSDSVIASCVSGGLTLIEAGAAASGLSLFNYETQQFTCGHLGQLSD